MSRANLEGRQADHNVDRPDSFVCGGFEETGREVVKKDYNKIAKAADKPDFFMGGCGPTVPTGPKRKLRSSWMANAPAPAPATVEHVPKPFKKWTPPAKKKLPPRSKSHDGTMDPSTTSGAPKRGGRRPFGSSAAKKQEDEKKEDAEPVVVEKPAEEQEKKEAPVVAKEEPTPKAKAALPSSASRSVSPANKPPKATPKPAEQKEATKEKPAWSPPAPMNIKKPLHAKMEPTEKKEEKSAPSAVAGDADKDKEIAQLKAEIEKLKEEKGALARDLKKTKGSASKNKELKEQVFELKQQLKKSGQATGDAKNFHKLENKLNTLKMVMDGKVNMNSLEDLQEHVNMLNMIINQDLKKEGMKNVWA